MITSGLIKNAGQVKGIKKGQEVLLQTKNQ